MSRYIGIKAPGGTVRHWKSVTADEALCGWAPVRFEMVAYPDKPEQGKCSRCDLLKNQAIKRTNELTDNVSMTNGPRK